MHTLPLGSRAAAPDPEVAPTAAHHRSRRRLADRRLSGTESSEQARRPISGSRLTIARRSGQRTGRGTPPRSPRRRRRCPRSDRGGSPGGGRGHRESRLAGRAQSSLAAPQPWRAVASRAHGSGEIHRGKKNARFGLTLVIGSQIADDAPEQTRLRAAVGQRFASRVRKRGRAQHPRPQDDIMHNCVIRGVCSSRRGDVHAESSPDPDEPVTETRFVRLGSRKFMK